MPSKQQRASKRTPQVIERIIVGLSGGTPMAVICREDGMPDPSTVWRWTEADDDLAQRIARAREAGFDAIAERARLTARGKMEDDGGDSSGDVQRDKLIIETDLKLLSKWDPKRYGEKVQHTGDGGGEIKIVIGPDDAAL